MRKHFILTSLAAIIATTGVAGAATDVTFSGNYTNTSGNTVNVADAVAAESYSYEKSDGFTRNVASQATDPTLSDFTYTDKDGNDADLSSGEKVQSDFTGTTSASGVVSTTQEIVAGANVERSNYSYTSGNGDTVELGTTAKDMIQNVDLDTTYTSGTQIAVTNGVADSEFDGTIYTVTIDGDDTYHLSADGTTLYHSNNTTAGEPEPGSALADAFTAMKTAYTTDVANVNAAKTETAAQWATEQTNFDAAQTAFTTDSATVATLNTRWGTYETAANLLATAQSNQNTAKDAYSANSADLTNALAVYDAPIETTINTRANNAIDSSVASGSIKTALDTKANNADVDAALALKANSSDLNDEATVRANADTTLQANIDAEATARANADTALQANIDAETTRATTAEAGLQQAITDEATARENADMQLQNQINQSIALADYQTLSKANSYTDTRVNALEKNVSGGVAAATALSAVNVGNVKKGEVSVGGGYGYYNSQSAMAFGAAMGLSDRWSVNAGAGIASGDKTQMTFRAGTNYKFKLF